VKPTIDCLYPWLGGEEGDPADPRIVRLSVTRSQDGQPDQGVTIKLWAHGRDYSKQPVRPSRPDSSKAIQSSRTKQGSQQEARMIENPCRLNTRKWIVCEGALAGKTVGEVQSELESVYPGSGRRIKEYVSDLRSENKLDIRIEGGRLVCLGRLP
jgi:hypothetical protein